MLQIVDKSECCGCTACANICPKHCIFMQEDKEGFRYPSINKNLCINCDLCMKICPIINYQNIEIKNEGLIYGVKNKDITIQKESTSGGAFWGLVQYTLSKKGIVYGAIYDEKYQVIHKAASTIDDCKQFQGSKYVESYISETLFKDIKCILESGRLVLFSGTPCQVAGLRSFLKKTYNNLILCDLICSSVPSPKIFRDYIHFIQQKRTLRSINMRWKGYGWNKSCTKLVYTNDSSIIGKGFAKLWTTIAFSHIVSRPSCHKCKFTSSYRVGDISIGDFWGVEKNYPDFFDDKGVSLVLVNTSKGRNVFNLVKNNFSLQQTTKEYCMQPRLSYPSSPSPYRAQFWEKYNSTQFEYFARKYWRYGTFNQLKIFIHGILSIFYHKLIQK